MSIYAFITEVREKERDYLQMIAYCQSLSISLAPTIPVISAVIMFLAHVVAGNNLTAAQVLLLQ
jgi:ATP-binding cassette subfamily C (CFTR/MRP) protein 5